MGAKLQGPFRVVMAGLVVLCAGRPALAVPANDDFANATGIGTVPFTANQNTTGATTEVGEPSGCGSVGSTIWYTYTATGTATLLADSLGSEIDTQLAVYEGTTLGGLTMIDCNDDFFSLQSAVFFDPVPGTTYYFQLGGFGGEQGQTTFHLRLVTCGDGVLAGDEECDDGNTASGDGCDATCMVEPDYTCQGSPSVCTGTSCGDGVIQGTEACDDGNLTPGDGCSDICTIEPGYSCTGAPSVCTASFFAQCPPIGADTGCRLLISATSPSAFTVDLDASQPPFDGFEDTLVGFQNDSGAPLCSMAVSSTAPIYGFDGDGICTMSPQPAGCPFGPTSYEGPGVTFLPTTAYVGVIAFSPCIPDGGATYFGLEETIPIGFLFVCDGNGTCAGGEDCTSCPQDCGPCSGCGDGVVAGGEACDDGNTTSGDGCSDTCTIEPGFGCTGAPSTCTPICGDGVVQAPETCDDGNVVGGDGCSSVCTVEPGFSCTGAPSTCAPTCGDGIVQAPEACDDGNLVNGDGCSNVCMVEPGFACTGAPSTCTPICGDGIIAGDESCDDGNTTNGDGCSATCHAEPGEDCTGQPSVCAPVCGDGIVVGPETCDPPDPTIDPVTGKATCRPDCTSCGDGVVQTETGTEAETCDDGNTAEGCVRTARSCAGNTVDGCLNNCTRPLCCDPSHIKLTPIGDSLMVHGQLMKFDTSTAAGAPFALVLTGADGSIVYQASLAPNDLLAFGTNRYVYRGTASLAAGGIGYVRLLRVKGRTGFRATIRAYGDLSRASPHMTTHVLLGAQEWTVTGTWLPARYGWKLPDK